MELAPRYSKLHLRPAQLRAARPAPHAQCEQRAQPEAPQRRCAAAAAATLVLTRSAHRAACAARAARARHTLRAMKEAKQLERKVEDINKPTELGLRIPDSKLQGLSLQEPRKFVSRAKHASWGPLPYSVNIEELLELPFVEVIIVSCILLSAFLAAVDTLPVLQEPNCSEVLFALNWVENSICICFFVEFWLRWYSRSFRPSYILKPLVIIDILAFLPVFIESVSGPPSFVAGFRLLRVFRLQRFLKDYNAFLTLATGLGIDRNYVTPVYLEAGLRSAVRSRSGCGPRSGRRESGIHRNPSVFRFGTTPHAPDPSR